MFSLLRNAFRAFRLIAVCRASERESINVFFLARIRYYKRTIRYRLTNSAVKFPQRGKMLR
jgi:hypothetical protein